MHLENVLNMNKLFIGREKEQLLLNQYLDSDQSEFIAIYGRRRIGKTFLIQKVVGNNYAFYVAGMNNVNMHTQLANFTAGLQKKGFKTKSVKNWLDAFIALENYLETLPEGRKIIFIDEMPWMDTPRSGFISGLEHFWNSWASWRDDIKLIVCGSATSWIINNLIKNRGGLHNRVTHKISLRPFTLKECQMYFDAKGFRLSLKQIAECYMVLGGVPFYLSKLNKGESVVQNIDRLVFSPDGELNGEFQSLYNSLYKNANNHIKIVTALATKGKGLTRREIFEKTGLSQNGKLSVILEELQNCGFIRSYEPFPSGSAAKRRSSINHRDSCSTLYQLVDPFTLFYFQIMKQGNIRDEHYWLNFQNSQSFSSWSGFAFEMLCLNHIEQIKQALGISGISTNVFSWFGKGEKRASQIDLLIDRTDKTINLCEMKFYGKTYQMNAEDAQNIEDKMLNFRTITKSDKNIIVTMITAKGIEQNEYSYVVQKELVLEDLFC